MHTVTARILSLLAAFLMLFLPAGCLAWGTPDPDTVLPGDAVWMDVVYESYDPDEVKVTQIITLEFGVSMREAPYPAAKRLAGISANTVLRVIGHVPGWYYVHYQGESGYVSDSSALVRIIACVTPQPATPTPSPVITPTPKPATPTPNRNPFAMDIPVLGDTVFQPGDMNLTIFWVQTQLRATGQWYLEDGCSVTGYLDETAAAAVAEFMTLQGYPDHGGVIDQNVIDELTDWLGSRIVPVYTGGFYEAMDGLLDGEAGTMVLIGPADPAGHTASGESVRWVQRCLTYLGYYAGNITGRYDGETRSAVRRFELDNGFPSDDRVNLGVARAMLEAYYYSRGDLGRLTGTAE